MGSLKILLLGDYSGCHATLARGLRSYGHKVTVASAGSGWQNTDRDIDLSRPFKGKAGGAWLWLKAKKLVEKELTGFDIVAINNPLCFDLRPERNTALLEKIMNRNRSVFLTAMGTDYHHIRECLNPGSKIRYNEWRIYGDPSPLARSEPETLDAWQAPVMREQCQWVYAHITGAAAVLYEYYVTLEGVLSREKISYCGIPVDLSLLGARAPRANGPLKIMLGRHRERMTEKGTDILEHAVRKAIGPPGPGKPLLAIAENLPAKKYLALQREADIILDQIYSYTPATNALWAMGRGQCAVTGAEEDYYDFIKEPTLRPAVNATPHPEELAETLCALLSNPVVALEKAALGPEFVKRHNSHLEVAHRCLDFWQRRLKETGL